jgi:hypothetical protein
MRITDRGLPGKNMSHSLPSLVMCHLFTQPCRSLGLLGPLGLELRMWRGSQALGTRSEAVATGPQGEEEPVSTSKLRELP